MIMLFAAILGPAPMDPSEFLVSKPNRLYQVAQRAQQRVQIKALTKNVHFARGNK